MDSPGADLSHDGHGSRSWTQVRIDRRSVGYCRVTFEQPPVNALTAAGVAELAELVRLIEQDADLNVVVFASADPDVYLAHDDAVGGGGHAWADLLVRLARAPVISIAAIRGRVSGAGNEFVLACDLRFASRENTLLGRLNAGPSGIAASGPMATLSCLAGRGRALELLLVAGDVDGARAEQYGYVNRLVADDRLDEEVDAIARRLARVDHDAIARTKAYVGRITLPGGQPAGAATSS